MRDSDHDALHMSGLGDTPYAVVDGSGSNKLLVVATIAALLLAGSAIAYRARPLYFSSMTTSLVTSTTQKDKDLLGFSKSTEKKSEESQRGDDDVGEQPSYAVGLQNGASSSMFPSTSIQDTESSAQSKSSRSKDRRKRGKDPIKEMLKGGKKLKTFSSSTTGSVDKNPVASLSATSNTSHFEDMNIEHGAGHVMEHDFTSQSSTSLTPNDSQQALSRAKGKRGQQRERLNEYNTMSMGDVLNGEGCATSSVGNSSARHTRRASEVSQKISQQLADGPTSYSPSKSSTLSRSPPSNQSQNQAHNDTNRNTHSPYSRQRKLPLSPTFEDGFTRPQSPMSASTTTSKHAADHMEIDYAMQGSTSPSFKESKAHHLGLADPGMNSEEITLTVDGDEQGETYKSLRGNITAITTSSLKNDIQIDVSSVETASSTTTATAPASLSSSIILSSPATSPALSSSPYPVNHSRTMSQMGGNDDDVEDISGASPDKLDSGSTILISSSSFTSSASITTIDKLNGAQKPSHGINATKRKLTLANSTPDPWDWDGVGSSSTSVEDVKEKEQEKQSPKHMLRLQPGSVKSGPSLSAVAVSGIPASATYPVSLYSPTGPTFTESVSGGKGDLAPGTSLMASVSAAAASGGGRKISSLSSGSTSDNETEEAKGKEEDVVIFPTLNPPMPGNVYSGAGSSRSIRRAPTPRRPNTPSRSSATGTPPPLPFTNNAPPHPTAHGNSNSNGNNSPTMSGSSSNGSMPALSTQTQLASLKGALEAARLREEKNKVETEKHLKEMEILRWENANWRRGEIELKAHVQNLMQQLQAYATFYASAAPQLNAQLQQQQVNGNDTINTTNAGPSASSTQNGTTGTTLGTTSSSPDAPQYADSSDSTTTQSPSSNSARPQSQPPQTIPTLPHPPPPPPLYPQQVLSGGMLSPSILSPIGGIVSPGGGPPIMGIHPTTPSGFYPYPVPHPHPMMAHAQQMHLMHQHQLHHQQQQHSQQNSALPSPHQVNMFSSIFSPGTSPSIVSPHQQHHYPAFVNATAQIPIHQVHMPSTSSSGSFIGSGPHSESSSAGSLSPDIAGPSSPSGLNSKRARTRTQIVNNRIGSRPSWEDLGDGWVSGGTPEERIAGESADGNGSNIDEEDSEINEVLADAILKRPGSIRVRSSSRRGQINVDMENKAETTAEDSSPGDKNDEHVDQLAEFTFPSLSNLGNVNYKSEGAITLNRATSWTHSLASPPNAESDVVFEEKDGSDSKLPLLPTEEVSINNYGHKMADGVTEKSAVSSLSDESDTTPRKETPSNPPQPDVQSTPYKLPSSEE